MTRNPLMIHRAARLAPLAALALALAIPEAPWAQACKTPPAGAPPCRTQIPEWTQIEYDCITGDHYANNATCNGTGGKPQLPSNRCDQPDIVTDVANGVQLRCNEYDSDFYEIPFAPGNSSIFKDQDLIYILATQDDTWWYFLLQLYSLEGGKLDAQYSVEMDADLDNPADYRPPGQASCNDWWMVSTSPTANIRDQGSVGPDQWGQNGVIAWYDATSNEPG